MMRPSTITPTMDTYGHLFPGQEAGTVARLPEMRSAFPKALQVTGTDGASLPIPRKLVAGMVADFLGNHCDAVKSIETTDPASPAICDPGTAHQKPLQLQEIDSDCELLRQDESK